MLGKEKRRPLSLRRRACPRDELQSSESKGLRAAKRSALRNGFYAVAPNSKFILGSQNVCTVTLTFNYTRVISVKVLPFIFQISIFNFLHNFLHRFFHQPKQQIGQNQNCQSQTHCNRWVAL